MASDYSWIPLFRNADSSSIQAALAGCETLTLHKGDILLKSGEKSDAVYIIVKGQLAVLLGTSSTWGQNDDHFTSQILLYPGECIGEISCLDDKPVSVSVVSTADSNILRIDGHLFRSTILNLPPVATNLLKGLVSRIRRTNEIALAALREQLELEHFKKELSLANEIQTNMLPDLTKITKEYSSVDLVGSIRPTASVGGDFYDVFPLANNHLFLCLGDVSGHGISAAVFMARVIGLIRSIASGCEDPAVILSTLNQYLCQGNSSSTFATVFCGVFDPSTGDLTYSNAGHCPPVLIEGNSVKCLELPRGPMVGAFDTASYANKHVILGRRDVVFVYSDGLTEAENASGVQYGVANCIGLLDSVCIDRVPALEDMHSSIVDSLHQHCEGLALQDDCTMLALQVI